MQLNHEQTEVYCHACLQWHDLLTQTLWMPGDDGRVGIYCLNHDQVLLGFEDDIK